MRVRLHSKSKPNNYTESCMINEADGWRGRDGAQPKLLESILYKDNFNRAYKRVKANPEYFAHMAANSRKGHWFNSNLSTVKRAMSKERLINSGFYDLATAYQSVHVNY